MRKRTHGVVEVSSAARPPGHRRTSLLVGRVGMPHRNDQAGFSRRIDARSGAEQFRCNRQNPGIPRGGLEEAAECFRRRQLNPFSGMNSAALLADEGPLEMDPQDFRAGIHFEGPFISKERRGVHPAKWIQLPSAETFSRFLKAAAGNARILTIAPELFGAAPCIDAAREAGLLVSMGHTDATYEQARAAMAWGARSATHLYNAMRPFSHRDPGVIGAVLTSPDVNAELIADGVHVEEGAMKLLLLAKGAAHITLVSDGLSATGMPDGKYTLGDFEVTVSGGVCRNAEGILAGSTLTLDRALRNIVALGASLPDAVRMLTLNPASLLGIQFKKGSLRVGADADILLLDEGLHVAGVWARGVALN